MKAQWEEWSDARQEWVPYSGASIRDDRLTFSKIKQVGGQHYAIFEARSHSVFFWLRIPTTATGEER